MADTLRDELAVLTRMVAAHVEWQRELGADGFERARPGVSRAASGGPTAPPSSPDEPAEARSPLRVERPDFMRRATAPQRPAPTPPPPVVVEVARVPAAPTANEPEPAPVARTLFGEPVEPPTSSGPITAPRLEGPAKHRALEVLRDEVAGCTRCRLHEKRTKTVFARGNPDARLMFVGEGPGRDEDVQGAPFVGAAGQLLDRIIGAMGMSEADVYIANVVKCRPPNNRVPQPDEMASCGPYLTAQIEASRPEVLVALGKTAASYLLGSSDSMGRMRRKWHEWRGIPLLVTWHPAYLLRQPEAKKDTWDDMKLVLEKLGRAVPPPRRGGAG